MEFSEWFCVDKLPLNHDEAFSKRLCVDKLPLDNNKAFSKRIYVANFHWTIASCSVRDFVLANFRWTITRRFLRVFDKVPLDHNKALIHLIYQDLGMGSLDNARGFKSRLREPQAHKELFGLCQFAMKGCNGGHITNIISFFVVTYPNCICGWIFPLGVLHRQQPLCWLSSDNVSFNR